MYANKAMGFRPWLQHAAASRLIAMLQNSISPAILSYRSKNIESIVDALETVPGTFAVPPKIVHPYPEIRFLDRLAA